MSSSLLPDGPAQLFCIGLREDVFPIVSRLAMPTDDFLLLLRIIQLDLLRSLIDPVEKELSGAFTDPLLVADLDIVRPGHGETIRPGHVGHGADQEPSAFVELELRQLSCF